MNRITLAIVAFFGAALFLYWQVHTHKNDLALINTGSHRPDYTANDLRTVEYNENGEVNSKVFAKHMEHYDDASTTFFTQPVYLIYPDKGQAQWRLQANRGQLDKKTGKVTLEDNVIIDSISSTEPIRTLKTSKLEVNLNTMIMTSDRQIDISGSAFSITGKGLYADLNAHIVKLTSKVEGTYAAQ